MNGKQWFCTATLGILMAGPPPTVHAQGTVTITSANPPVDNPYLPGTQPFRDVLQTGNTPALTQGIGGAGTPAQDSIAYSPISVSFSGAPSPLPDATNIAVACTGSPCPTVSSVVGGGAGPYALTLSGPILPGHCTTLLFAGTTAGQRIDYQYLPGDVDMSGTTSSNDLVRLAYAQQNGIATPATSARFDINRDGTLNGADVTRLTELLNGVNTTQAWVGAVVAACPAVVPTVTLDVASAVCVGGTATATAVGAPGGGACTWQATSSGTGQVNLAPNGCSATITGTADSSVVDDVTIKVTYTLNGVPVAKEKKLTVALLRPWRLDYSGTAADITNDDTGAAYTTPHWEDGNLDGDADDAVDRRIPVCYKRNTTVGVSNLTLAVSPNGLTLNNVAVTGAGPDGDDFTGTGNINAGALTIAGRLNADDTLPNTVKFYNPYNIAWKITLPGTDPCNVGTTGNRGYVTLDTPVGTKRESFFDIGTKAADGKDDVQPTIDAIWDEFKDRQVKNVKGNLMGYYRGILCASQCSVLTAEELVTQENGQCGSWANLLIACFKTQGIDTAAFVIIAPRTPPDVPADCNGLNASGFIVKDYTFAAAGTSGCANYPFKFNDPCQGTGTPSGYGAWGAAEVTDAAGIPGQDEANPASWFGLHFIVKINANYYDPSYGTGPFGGGMNAANLAWEQGGIAGYWGEATAPAIGTPAKLGVREDVNANRETFFDQ